MRKKALLILAAGNSSRMKRDLEAAGVDASLLLQANTMPKGMIGVGNNGRPFLDYQLFNASKGGFTEVAIVLNEKDTVTKPYYEQQMAENKAFGLHISFVYQRIPADRIKPLGTADAVHQALEQLPQWAAYNVTACNSDNLYSANVFRLLYQSPNQAALPSYHAYSMGFDDDKIKNCAILFVNKNGYLDKLIEKPNDEQIESCKAYSGRLGISMNIFSFDYELALSYMRSQPLNASRGEKEMPEAVSRMATEHSDLVKVYEISEIMPDLTSKADLKTVQDYLISNFPEL